MDLATENRIATILLKEAAELRRQAEKEGALVYLRQPNVRGRPNSRFLTATVLGVQQANRAVEEGEMWRARQKERELDNRLHGRTSDDDSRCKSWRNTKESQKTSNRLGESEVGVGSSCLARQVTNEDSHLKEDEALKDDEVDDFLRSRVKRGRGAVGSRMDETGPYLPRGGIGTGENQCLIQSMDQMEREKKRVRLGPEKPSFIEDSRSLIKKHKEVKQASSKHNSSEKHNKSKSKDKDKKIKKKKRSREEKNRKLGKKIACSF